VDEVSGWGLEVAVAAY
jgi:hypothetical protein